MRTLFFVCMVLLPFLGFAQDEGIHFEKTLSWTEVQEKAKKENKFIFVDCFTTWCGPCQQMAHQVFPLKEMGDFFNDKFINVKIQFDERSNDGDYVKSWRPVAEEFAKKYNVTAYPTFLYFSPEGKLVHRVVGGGAPKDFIAKSEKALKPETQYYTMLEKFNKDPKTPEAMRKMAIAAQDIHDKENAEQISKDYLAVLKESDYYTKDNLIFFYKFATTSKSKGFKVLLDNPAKVDELLGGEGIAMGKIKQVVAGEEIYSRLYAKGASGAWIPQIDSAVNAKYPAFAEELLLQIKVQNALRNNDWPTFQQNVVTYMKKYGQKADVNTLNEFAWAVFENCADEDCVKEALGWSKRSLDMVEDPGLMDTYANLLYKLGQKDEAIAMEEKAIKLCTGNPELLTMLQSTVEKMKKGEKTWK